MPWKLVSTHPLFSRVTCPRRARRPVSLLPSAGVGVANGDTHEARARRNHRGGNARVLAGGGKRSLIRRAHPSGLRVGRGFSPGRSAFCPACGADVGPVCGFMARGCGPRSRLHQLRVFRPKATCSSRSLQSPGGSVSPRQGFAPPCERRPEEQALRLPRRLVWPRALRRVLCSSRASE